jgi:hypothetical protein
LSCDPTKLNGLSEKLIVSHWENNHGGAIRRLNAITARPTSTVLRISRKTGKILWKLGAPTVSGQHAPTLLPNGNILIFDNGVHRLDDSMPFSRVIEVDPATNKIAWKYQDKPAWNFFSPRMGNAQRLPNGNTLVCESSFGRFFEITRDGAIVWEYVNLFFGKPFFAGPPTTEGNLVFRVDPSDRACHRSRWKSSPRSSRRASQCRCSMPDRGITSRARPISWKAPSGAIPTGWANGSASSLPTGPSRSTAPTAFTSVAV